MNDLDLKELSNTFYIYEDLTPNKLWKTYVAFYKDSELMEPVIIKEMDEKRAFIYQDLSHSWNPHIANVYSVHRLPNTQLDDGQKIHDVYIAVTENVGEMTLTDYVRSQGPLDYKTALKIGIQICEGLSTFHKKGFVHRDIKPDNIMMFSTDPDNVCVKIIDLGAAKEVDKTKIADTTVIGTLGYQAPESLSSITKASADIFAVGCILNFMLTGQEPGVQRYVEKTSMMSIIEKATNVDPSSRYSSVDEFKKNLLHELGYYRLDRIPVLRSIPGFRTHTLWKMFVSSFVYILMFHMISTQFIQGFYMVAFLIFVFWLIVPLILFCNLGNQLIHLPENIRSNSKRMFTFRFIAALVSFLLPFALEYF